MESEQRACGGLRPVCDFSVVCSRAQFDALEPEWNALFSRDGRPHQVFQAFGWLWHWANHYLDKDTELAVVIARRQGRLVLVWPLVVTRVTGVRILSFMGEPVSQYGDLVLEDGPDADEVLAAAFNFVTTLPVDLVSLRRIRDDAILAAIFERASIRLGTTAQAPFVDFSATKTTAAFEQRFSAKVRSNRRRRLRRLQDLGPVVFETRAPGQEALDLVENALAFKREWALRSGQAAPALFDPRFRQFFLALAQGRERVQGLRISAVRCAGEAIGVEMAVACKGHLFGHVLAARPGLEKYGVGAIIANYSIASAIEQGFMAFDLLAPADEYKMEWATGCVGVRDISIARTLSGDIFRRIWLDFGRDAVKSLVKNVPVLLQARENVKLASRLWSQRIGRPG